MHNLRDVDTQIGALKEWKQDGRIRYLGITTSNRRQYEAFENVMLGEQPDFIISHPAVTTVIPGTTKERHAADNMGAARGELPNKASRKRMEEYYDALPDPG